MWPGSCEFGNNRIRTCGPALVNWVINFKVPQNLWGISSVAEDLLASQEGLCSMELVSQLILLDNSS